MIRARLAAFGNEPAKRLETIPGIGVVTASAPALSKPPVNEPWIAAGLVASTSGCHYVRCLVAGIPESIDFRFPAP